MNQLVLQNPLTHSDYGFIKHVCTEINKIPPRLTLMVKIPSVGNVHSLSTAQVLNLPRVSSPGDRIEIYVLCFFGPS